MTVEELIEQLRAMPPTAHVDVFTTASHNKDDDDDEPGDIVSVTYDHGCVELVCAD